MSLAAILRRGRAALFITLLFAAPCVQAHIASNGFLVMEIHGQEATGSIELSIRDVELAIGVDGNGDARVTWAELKASEPRLLRYLGDNLRVGAGEVNCPISFEPLRVNARVDGNYAWVPFTAHCPVALKDLRLGYHLMHDEDPSHRGLFTLTEGTVTTTAVVGGDHSLSSFAVDHPSRARAFLEYLRAGIGHIWSGVDHLLFLVSLLLPAVLLRRGNHWQPVAAARPAFVSVLKVVTAFTVAHSLTLSLAALGIVRLPSRLTESVIAASIVVAALNNIVPLVTESRARIAFAFGLLHGFGFASVLADMGLPPGARLLSLLAFNLGIETGQLAVVLAVMPILYGIRTLRLYRRTLLPWGSAAIAMLASAWFVQRAFLASG
jgi:hypothetical protein